MFPFINPYELQSIALILASFLKGLLTSSSTSDISLKGCFPFLDPSSSTNLLN